MLGNNETSALLLEVRLFLRREKKQFFTPTFCYICINSRLSDNIILICMMYLKKLHYFFGDFSPLPLDTSHST